MTLRNHRSVVHEARLLLSFLLLAQLLASCGGGGGGSPAPSGPGNPTPPSVSVPTAGMRVEETSTAMVFSGSWVTSDSSWGWSGGDAVQSNVAGATASVTFSGTSVRWLGSRGRGMGIALVSVDGGPT